MKRSLFGLLLCVWLITACATTEPTATPVPATVTPEPPPTPAVAVVPTAASLPTAPPTATATAVPTFTPEPEPTPVEPDLTDSRGDTGELSSTSTLATVAAEISDSMESLTSRQGFSGVVLVAHEGEPLFMGAYGLANRALGIPTQIDTKFNLGSMDKMFTAVAILQLVEQGELSLDDTIADHLPEYPNQQVAEAVTIDQLLTHRSGMGDWSESEPFPDLHDQIREVADYLPLFVDTPLEFEPGDRFRYSNSGYIVLGLIVESVTGTSYYDHVRTTIFEPSGMTNTAAYELDAGVPNLAVGYTNMAIDGSKLDEITDYHFAMPMRGGPSGGGFSTVEDLLAFGNALLAHQLLSPESTELLLEGKVRLNEQAQYAYGFIDRMLDNQRVVGHGGGAPGVCCMMDIYLEWRTTLVVLSNSDSDCLAPSEAIRAVLPPQ